MLYQNAGNDAVLSALPLHIGRLLDVGCGAGDNVRRLKGRFDEAVGLTHDEQEVAVAAPHFTNVFVQDLDQPIREDVGADFDAVIASHVLEHLRWPERTLANVRRRMRVGGVIVVALPNLFHYSSRANMLLGRFEYAESGLMDRTHLRWFTFETGRALLEDAGFEVERAWVDGTFPFWRTRSVLPRAFQRTVVDAAARMSPGLFGGQLLYRGRVRG